MMREITLISVGIILVVVLASCRKPYDPPVVAANTNYLVVEGIINTGADSTIISLSRTVNIAQNSAINPELNAVVSVESDNNNNFPLLSQGNGKYVSPGLNLGNMHNYRLHINTSDGKAYVSDFVEPKASPPIDSLGYIVQPNGVQIYLNTHDPQNNSHYYLWVYNETWIFHAFYNSTLIVSADSLRLRSPLESVYKCFASDTTSTIVLNSSAKLSSDVIKQTPITFVPSTSEKLEDRYSILVKQYVLTPQAYDFYTILKTNTQNLGSIFDAQPSQLPGNIHCTSNPSQPVIGYVSAGTIAQKRIYIDSRNLPNWVPVTYYDQIGCLSDTMTIKSTAEFDFYFLHNPPYYIPTTEKFPAAYPICIDCTLRGSKTPPPFWQN